MKNLDTTKILKRIIIVSWVALIVCFLVKLLGGNIFEIVCSNERFIAICNYADNHLWLYCIMVSLHSVIVSYFIVCAMCGKLHLNTWQTIVLMVGNVAGSCIKSFGFNMIGLVFDLFNAIIFPCICTLKLPKRHWFVLMGNGLLLVFQVISMVTKNFGLNIITVNGLLISIIFSIDVSIMSILYYLYSYLLTKKGKRNGSITLVVSKRPNKEP